MTKRIWYFDFLKVFASFAVVFIHVISEYWYTLNPLSMDFKVLTIFDSLCRFCVPIYFMVSGALFLREEKEITIKTVLTKYIPRIFIMFVVWNMIYSVFSIVFVDNSVITFKGIVDCFISTILGKGVFHLNFLVILLGFYLCIPVLRCITKKENKKVLEYFIIILFAFTSLNNIIGSLFNIKLLYPLLFTGLILYFILGYYLHTFSLNKKATNTIYILGIISIVLTAFLSIYYSIYINKPSEVFFEYLAPNVVLFSSALFLFIKNKFKVKNEKVLSNFGKLYLGIYLIHGLVFGFYIKIGLFTIDVPLIIKVMLGTLVIYVTSYIVSYILSKIPYVKKIIYF